MKKRVLLFIYFVLLAAGTITAQDTIKFNSLAEMKSGSYGFGIASNIEYIFLIGGATDSYPAYLNTLERYYVEFDLWERLRFNLIPRRFLNTEYVPSLKKLFVFNGEVSTKFELKKELYASRKSKSRLTDIVEVLDLETNIVKVLDSNPYPVLSAGSAEWNNKIYFFGGWNPIGYSDRIYVYDPVEDDWSRLEDMPEAKITSGKIVDGILYTFGGSNEDNPNFNSIHAYSIKENKWSLAGQLPEGISANAAASDGRNIWLVGSNSNLNFLAAFDTKTKTVKTFNSNLISRKYAGAQVLNNKLYVFDGTQDKDMRSSIHSVQCADIPKFVK